MKAREQVQIVREQRFAYKANKNATTRIVEVSVKRRKR